MVVRLLSQGFAQNGDVPGEPSLFHNRVAPDPLEQLVFGEHAFPMLDERNEQLHDFWSQGTGSPLRSKSRLPASSENGPNS